MKISIKRKNKFNHYEYLIDENEEWLASTNYTYMVLLRKITLKNIKTNDVYELKEKSPHINIAKLVFIIICITGAYNNNAITTYGIVALVFSIAVMYTNRPYFKAYQNGVYIGKSYIFSSYSEGFKFSFGDNDIYYVNAHSNFKTSIVKNDEQLGLIIRDPVVVKEQNEYKLLFSKDRQEYLHIILLLTLFVDSKFYPLKISNYSFKKIQSRRVLFDKYKDRAKWVPND